MGQHNSSGYRDGTSAARRYARRVPHLSDVLLAIYCSNQSFSSASGEARWSCSGGYREAVRRARGEPPEGPGHWKAWDSSIEKFSVRPPKLLRLEATESRSLPRLRILNLPEWWTYDETTRVAEGRCGDQLSSPGWLGFVPELLDPTHVLPTLDMVVVGATTAASRPAVELRGKERVMARRSVVGSRTVIPMYATEHRLWIDAEFGVLLKAISFLDDHQFNIAEIVSIEFNNALDDEIFVFTPPPGVELRPRARACRIRQPDSSLEDDASAR